MTGEMNNETSTPFPGFIGHANAVRHLAAALRSGRLGHSYLITGPEGVGKEFLALAVAKALNCPNSQPDGPLYCGECSTCRRIDKYEYPDVILVFPVPGDRKFENGYNPDVVAKQLEEKRLDPCHKIEFDRNVQILVGQIKEMIGYTNSAPLEGKRRVIIITQTQAMNIATANAFLKSLEEPPEHTVFILTTSQPNLLPTTIISRCHLVRLGRLTREETAAVLESRTSFSRETVERVVPLAAGSAGRAMELARENFAGIETQALKLLDLAELDDLQLAKAIYELSRPTNREKLLKAMEVLCVAFYELALNRSGETAEISAPQPLREWGDKLKPGPDQALAAFQATEEAKEAIRANVNLSMLLTPWALTIRSLLR